eukprot:CAMPEP_0178990828 /NCGR_PEP_ID=MMETSP0795-20121207/5182_1 /TAXON_ID=88552 /ORGANISM="Amoebophrya sp., Strain Ameob2" /LENGTH=945 /DNA_ID=CAMNT_0020682455 /DNA_START=123 /DNA_END=2960 /DNA_ORIENTATION=+
MPERESLDGAERLDALAGDGKKRLSNPDSILDGEISLGDGNKSKQSLPSVSGYQNWSKKSSAKESSAASKDHLVAPQKGRSRSEAEIVDELLEKQSQAASQVVPEDEEEEIAFPQAASQVVSEDVGLAHEGGSGKEDAEDIIEELGMPDDIVEGVVGEKEAEQKIASKEGEQIFEDVEMQSAAVENAAFEEEKAAEDVEMQEGEEKPDIVVEAAAEVITPVVEPASVEAAAEREIEIGEGAEVATDEKIEDAEGVLPEEPIADEIGLPDALEPEVVAEKDEKVSDELKQEVKEEAPPSASPMEEASAPAFTQQAVAIGASSDSAVPRASASVDEIDASAVWAAEQASKTGSPSEELAAGLVGYEVEQEAAVDYEEVEAEGTEKGSFVPAETAKADVIEKSSDSADEAVQQVEVEKSVPVAPEAESKAAPVQPETKEDVAMEDVEEHGVESAAAAPPAVEARVFAEDDRDVEMAPAGSGSRDDELKGAAVAAAGPLVVGEKVEKNGCSEQEPLAKEEDVLEEKIVPEKKYSTRESFSFGGMAAPAVVEGEAEAKEAEPEPQGEDAIEADKSVPVELPKQPDVVFPADESAILKEDEDLDGDTIKESLHDLKSKDGASVSAAAGKGKGTSSATTGAAKGGKSKSAASSAKGNGKSASTIKGGKKASTMGKSPRNASGGPRGASNKSPRQAAAASSKSPRQEAGAAHTSTTSPRHVVKGSGKAGPAAGASSVRPNTAKAPAAAAGAPPPVSTSAENGKASAATAMKKRPATAPANGGSTPLLKKQKTGPQGLTPSKRAEMETTEANRKSKFEDQLKSKAKKAEEAAKAKEQLKEVNLLRKEMGERLHSAICLVKRAKGGSWIVPDGEIRFDRVEFTVLTAMFPTCEWKAGSEPSTKTATATKNDAQQAFGVGKCKGGAQGVKAEVVGLKLTYAAKGKYLKMVYEMKTL